MPKPTKHRKKVKPAVIPFDLLARFASELGRKEAARRFKVHPSTLGRWLKKGVPADSSRRVQVAIRRRTLMLEMNARRTRRAEYEAEYAGAKAPKRRPAREVLQIKSDDLDDLQWEHVKAVLPQLRELAEAAWDAGDFKLHRSYANQLTILRENFKTLRKERLLRTVPYPELWDATLDTIDDIVQKLALRTGKLPKYFYRMWATP